MRLITWNTAGRKRKAEYQVRALASREPDIVALQEVRLSTLKIFRKLLPEIGLKYFLDSFSHLQPHVRAIGPRQYAVVIATSWPIREIDFKRIHMPWPEKLLAVTVAHSQTRFQIFTTHIPPGSSNGWIKIETLESLYQAVIRKSRFPKILCGDFNTPQAETSDGISISWAYRRRDRDYVLKKRLGKRWDNGEINILRGLEKIDMPDVYRMLHGYRKRDYSWFVNRSRKPTGRRFDHCFASSQLQPISAKYIHNWRKERLSDHSALEIIFDLSGSISRNPAPAIHVKVPSKVKVPGRDCDF